MGSNVLSHPFFLPILLAGIGGFFLNMMNLYQDQKRPKNRRTSKDSLYWTLFVFWPIAGALLALIYLLDGSSLKPILAFSIGLTAPTTLQTMLKATTEGESNSVGVEED
jgi:hypothetical protein